MANDNATPVWDGVPRLMNFMQGVQARAADDLDRPYPREAVTAVKEFVRSGPSRALINAMTLDDVRQLALGVVLQQLLANNLADRALVEEAADLAALPDEFKVTTLRRPAFETQARLQTFDARVLVLEASRARR
jgi:hypothetical protein